MTNKTITLACPFCGGEPKVTRTSGDERDGYALRISYVCKGCGCSRGASGTSAEGGYADNSTVDQRALAAWNTRAALADPVPPAGVEVELPQRQNKDGAAFSSQLKVNGWNAACDAWAPHVTRLQAEVERLEEQACISGKNMLDQWNRANALQSELTKAREVEVLHLNACPSCSGRFAKLKTCSNAMMGHGYYVECESCGAKTSGYDKAASAAHEWNGEVPQ